MKPTLATLLVGALLLTAAACDNGKLDDTGTGEAEVLDPEPAGAPTAVADGRLTCLGNNEPDPASSGALELTGYVRTFADPNADDPPPAATVEIYDGDGTLLETGFADSEKDGRVAISVPVRPAGFTGSVVVSEPGYLDWRFTTSLAITGSSVNGWAWLLTETELADQAANAGVDISEGVLIGAVHDCDGFGVANAVVVVDGDAEPEDLTYFDGFDASGGGTYTGPSGRFAVPFEANGSVTIKAFARLESGGPLVLLSTVTTAVSEGMVSSVSLEPRAGLQ
jgi:hypothetical protein